MKDLIKSKIKKIIVEDLGLGIKMEEINEDVSLIDGELAMDSITIVNFIVEIEKQFEITLDENEISGRLFESINSLADFIESKSTLEQK
ncbi:acyl carrier protein [Sphingobacterium siyangense]|uniref:acyl carrier protein n=1 Tax=Sphingobacterium siyangense TaxID=459529 RepID=UPI00289FBA74|nr:phosphopantetheine-binding protein [Sphingobacterium siyangense]